MIVTEQTPYHTVKLDILIVVIVLFVQWIEFPVGIILIVIIVVPQNLVISCA